MFKSFFKTIPLFIPIIFSACGEITYDDLNTTTANTNNNETLTTSQSNEDITYGNSEIDNAQQANETISGTEANSQKLADIIEIVETMETTTSNETQKTEILTWIKSIALEVNELTNKNYLRHIDNTINKNLVYLSENIYSTNESLYIHDDGNPTFIGLAQEDNNLVIINKSAEIANVENTIVLCTGDLNISHSHNNIIIAKGELYVGGDGVSEYNTTIDGSIIYSKNLKEIAHSYDSIFLFANQVQSAFIYGSDCINTGSTSSSHGQCNEITTTNLIED
jgi:hypothetical protein